MREINKIGFSLIELMVVVAILALLTAASLASFTNLRGQSRDAARVVHITQLQTALRAYYRDQGVYPTAIAAGQSIISGTVMYMEMVPNSPQPTDGSCTATTTYPYTRDAGGQSYHINFCLGDKAGDLPLGNHIAIPGGIQ